MGFFEKLLLRKLRQKAEKKAASELVARHWPAIEKTLRELGYDTERDFKVARVACERLIEHML
ncbi:MAG: hypothetical protein JRD89_00020 [Deltaproteobacteria bacterium]|nr:hypothetical protein [Deltaproteobacteria bacterium]